MITLEHNKTQNFGEIITIIKDGEPIARLRQIGKRAPDADVRLEWLTWQGNKRIEHAMQFPMCNLSDVTQSEVESMVKKYL
jgi:antitoxin (DNA-binding transcriptional repressor) of toxin-antitoxin stability system